MSKLLNLIVVIGIVSIVGILCFFSCILVSQKKEIWGKIKFKGEKNE